MKRALLVFLALVLLLPAAACGTATPAAMPKYVVATDATWPPMEMVDENTKEFVGFDIDLMTAIAAEAGFEVEFRNVTWDGIFAGLAAGDYNAVISSVTITEERQKEFDFSTPYINAGQIVIVLSSNTDIKGSADLAGKTVGAQIGTTGAFAVGEIAGATLKEYDEIGFAFEDLIAGRVDAVVCDTPVAADYAGVQYKDQIKLVGAAFTEEYYGIMVKKGDAELLAKINDGLAKVQAKGIDKQLMAKWGMAGQ
jgi:polar amino acid transport system substrate-binding protein